MFFIDEEQVIHITRGDIAHFCISATTDNGSAYVFKVGDIVRIKVFEKKACENVVMQKDFGIEAETDIVDITLDGKDTKIGEVISKVTDYWYEIELNPLNEPQTIIGFDEDGAKVFKLYPEGDDFEDVPIEPEDIPIVDDHLDITSTRPIQNRVVAEAIINLQNEIEAGGSGGSGATPEQLEQIAKNTSDIKIISVNIDSLSREVINIRNENEDIHNEIDVIRNEMEENSVELQAGYDVLNARMNAFTSLPSGSTSGNAELVDARVDYKGNTHTNVGEHIRKVSEELNDGIELIKAGSVELIKTTSDYTVKNDYYYDYDGGYLKALTGFVAVEINLDDVDIVKVYGYQGHVCVGLAFVNSAGNYIAADDGDTFHAPTQSGYYTWEFKKPKDAVLARTCFSVTSDRTWYVETYKYEYEQPYKIDTRLSDIIMIPIFGQSLSIGSAATPAISTSTKYNGAIMFDGGVRATQKDVSYFTDFEPLKESGVETVASGCVEKIIEQIQSENGISAYSNYWNNHQVLFVTCGEGSTTVSQLAENYFQGLVNALEGAKNICDSKGLSLNIPCWIWIQGETDQKEGESTSKPETTATDLETYKTRLISLNANLNGNVKRITNQTNDIKCICYQTGSQNIVALNRTPSYTNTNVMGVPTAQMQLVRDNENFVASSPVYVLTHSEAEPIHLSAEGEKMLGLYCGLASKAVMFGEKSPTGLTPKTYSISGNTLEIKYNVPVLPLRIDTTWVKEVENYGFTLLNPNDDNIIRSVSVYDDTVIIECSASPLNAMLFYGFNGTEWKDGRKEGSRGNICDSAQFVFNGEIGGKRYTLGNYAYSFVKHLNEASGII